MKRKKREPNYAARLAQVLRDRIARGEPLNDRQATWLASYRKAHPIGRPPAAFEKPQLDNPPDIDTPLSEDGAGRARGTLPPLNVSPGVASAEKEGEIQLTPLDSSSSEPAMPSPNITMADIKAQQEGSAGATKFMNWIRRMSEECEAMGGVGVPDFCDPLIEHAAKGSFTRASKVIGSKMSERMEDATVVIVGAGMYVQRHLLQRSGKQPMRRNASVTPLRAVPQDEPRSSVEEQMGAPVQSPPVQQEASPIADDSKPGPREFGSFDG